VGHSGNNPRGDELAETATRLTAKVIRLLAAGARECPAAIATVTPVARGWHAERVDGLLVWTHNAYEDVRIQPGPYVDDQGQRWPHGLNVARLIDDRWTVDQTAPTFIFVDDARDYIEAIENDD
jgi:hypothetical protein